MPSERIGISRLIWMKLTMLGMVCTQQRLFDQFLDLAKSMGTHEWQRITTMSEMAEKHRHYELALAIYETCLEPGMHEKFLREKFGELQKRIERKRQRSRDDEEITK